MIRIGIMSFFRGLGVWFALFGFVLTAAAEGPPLTATPHHLAARAYYVSSSSETADDNGPGTESAPWKTLGRVSAEFFIPGDEVLLKRGDVWTGEELILHGSGNFADDTWIKLGAYGTGNKPRITNPPKDETPGLVNWTAINEAYGTDRDDMTIAVRIADDANGWMISGLEIDHAEMGLYRQYAGIRFRIEDMYIHDIQGMIMPIIPNFEELCAVECPTWSPFPFPTWGSAIELNGDYVTIRDVVIENATGGISGYGSLALIENVFIDKVESGGLAYGYSLGLGVTIRYATVLNAGYPDGFWNGSDPVQLINNTGFILERSDIAYTEAYNQGGDSSTLDFDLLNVNCVVRDNFFHDNTGSALEFNIGGGQNHLITIENNVCYNNGLGEGYLSAAFSADANYDPGTNYTIRDNIVYKAFPDQFLNYYINGDIFTDDFSPVSGQYTIGENPFYEHDEYILMPVPEAPPIFQTNIASDATVTVSSDEGDTAELTKDWDTSTEWVSREAKPSIRYTWDTPQTIDRIRLFDRPDLANWATSGILTFSDGSRINVTGGILNNGAMREVIFDAPKTVTWVQFTVTRNALSDMVPGTLAPLPGTNVGLTEFQVYLAPVFPPVIPPLPDPGDFTVDFDDGERPDGLLTGRYPDSVNGIDWYLADWTTATDPTSNGNHYLTIDFPRPDGETPAKVYRMFILPRGKVLKSLTVHFPASPAGVPVPGGANVSLSQGFQGLTIDGLSGKYDTDWTSPAESNIVAVTIDMTNLPANDLNDVWFDDIVYGD